MNIGTCKKHGAQLHTEPVNDRRPSHCLKCVAAAVKLRPKSFFLTDDFKRLLERVEKK